MPSQDYICHLCGKALGQGEEAVAGVVREGKRLFWCRGCFK